MYVKRRIEGNGGTNIDFSEGGRPPRSDVQLVAAETGDGEDGDGGGGRVCPGALVSGLRSIPAG